jgi:hypothetical protein
MAKEIVVFPEKQSPVDQSVIKLYTDGDTPLHLSQSDSFCPIIAKSQFLTELPTLTSYNLTPVFQLVVSY